MVLTTKRLVAVVAVSAASICLAASIQAQTSRAQPGQPTPEQLRARQDLEKQLGITTAQKNKIAAIESKYRPQMAKIQEQMFKLRQQMISLAADADKEVQAVLTPAQRDKIKKLEEAQLKRLQSGQGPAGGAPKR